MLSWFIALILTLIFNFRKLLKLKTESRKIREIIKNHPDKKPTWEKDIARNNAATKTCYLTIVKCFGDLFPSGIGSGISLLFGNQFNDGHAGIGGLVSAVISCYEISAKIN